jgi:hypothetical protein
MFSNKLKIVGLKRQEAADFIRATLNIWGVMLFLHKKGIGKRTYRVFFTTRITAIFFDY